MKQPVVYIITNKRNGTLYVGVTSNLTKRIYEHKNELLKGFSKKYNCKILVFYELHDTMISAITREKQICY
ncbi:MAG TPA: GIY-YIG nuclease family protein [Rickettsia endosymbiont of Bembidion lapponicum]|nr:GIY-YIG nuclease family protein [Rickettsia endosymbiont of Bembidion lapponicum]